MATKTKPIPTPDRTIRLADLHGLPFQVARAMIARHGFWTFTDASTGEKVKVVA